MTNHSESGESRSADGKKAMVVETSAKEGQ